MQFKLSDAYSIGLIPIWFSSRKPNLLLMNVKRVRFVHYLMVCLLLMLVVVEGVFCLDDPIILMLKLNLIRYIILRLRFLTITRIGIGSLWIFMVILLLNFGIAHGVFSIKFCIMLMKLS